MLEEGAQIVADPAQPRPKHMLGHVTSSYWSTACGRPIALALVEAGRAMFGKTLFATTTAGFIDAGWDGHVTHYEARSSGTAHYNLFGASPVVINELKGQVIETCLNSLMNQLVQDTPLYMASKTPLPASTIHTVTVKARRPATLQGALPAIPVSEHSAP